MGTVPSEPKPMSSTLQPTFSVIVATRNRATQLKRLLTSLNDQQSTAVFEVVVVDNGSSDGTAELLTSRFERFTLVPQYEGNGGKSHALNMALQVAKGSLLAFTDDDVTVSPEWLSSLYGAFETYDNAAVFCGPIVPVFPVGTSRWLMSHPYSTLFFARFEPNGPLGLLPEDFLPFGANFAIRAEKLRNQRFRLDLGPSREDQLRYDEDTEFLRRFRMAGETFIYSPLARVFHHIEPERVSLAALFERAFHFGRSRVIRDRKVVPADPTGFVPAPEDAQAVACFERGCVINFYCGQLTQFHKLSIYTFDPTFEELMAPLEISENRELLSISARIT